MQRNFPFLWGDEDLTILIVVTHKVGKSFQILEFFHPLWENIYCSDYGFKKEKKPLRMLGTFRCSQDLQLCKHFELSVSTAPAFIQTQNSVVSTWTQDRLHMFLPGLHSPQARAPLFLFHKTGQDTKLLEHWSITLEQID